MALGAMTSWGAYSVLIDKANERGVAPLTAIRKAFGWSLVMMLPLIFWGGTESGFYALDGSFSINLDRTENVLRFADPMNWMNLIFLGVFASALSFIAWSNACAALGVVRTTICLYLEPIIGVGFAALFLGERPTLMSACGGAITIVGVDSERERTDESRRPNGTEWIQEGGGCCWFAGYGGLYCRDHRRRSMLGGYAIRQPLQAPRRRR